MLFYIYLILGAVVGVSVSVGSGLADRIADVWIVVLMMLAAFFALLVLHFIVLIIISACLRNRKDEAQPDSFVRKFAMASLEMLLKLARVRLHVNGEEKLPDGTFVMVCNHRSLMDPVTSIVAFQKHNLAFVSKKENVNVPVFGSFIANIGCLYLDRENARAAVQTINKAAEAVRSGKWSMAICPEGTRNRTEELLLPFHAGSFKIAQKAKKPLVIAVFRGTERVKRNAVKRKTDVYIDILEVIPPEKVCEQNTTELADHAKDVMTKSLERSGR